MIRKKKEKSLSRGSQDRSSDFRELVSENDRKLYLFCSLMTGDVTETEELVLSIFREFGEHYRKESRRRDSGSDKEMRLNLYRIAWQRVREWLSKASFPWTIGRDTRTLKHVDEDVLEAALKRGSDKVEAQVYERMRWVDPDFRAPLILRDLLQFEDEESAQILGLRWGVYRHRLNRGRLDFKDSLRGRFSTFEEKESTERMA